MNRAETIKKLVLQQKEAGQFHEQVHIENNSTGHSYKTLFGRFLDEDVQYVSVEDPYIRSFHQVSQNCTVTTFSCHLLKSQNFVFSFKFVYTWFVKYAVCFFFYVTQLYCWIFIIGKSITP